MLVPDESMDTNDLSSTLEEEERNLFEIIVIHGYITFGGRSETYNRLNGHPTDTKTKYHKH